MVHFQWCFANTKCRCAPLTLSLSGGWHPCSDGLWKPGTEETWLRGAFIPLPAALNLHAPGDARTCQKPSACAPGASRPWHRTRTCGYLHAPRIAPELTRLFTHPTWMPCLWSVLTGHDGPAVPVREDCAGGGGRPGRSAWDGSYVPSGEGRCSGEITRPCRQPFCLALVLAAPATPRESSTWPPLIQRAG